MGLEICFDTETTGVRPGVDEVLEISVLDWSGSVLFEGRFRPERAESWPGASKVNGIYPADVEQCPPFSSAAGDLAEIFGVAERVAGYNVGFDLAFLGAAGVRAPGAEVVDAMREFSEIAGRRRWPKLTEAAELVGHEWRGGPHGARADALATLAVLRWCRRARPRIEAAESLWREALADGTAADAAGFLDERFAGLDPLERSAAVGAMAS